MLGIIHTITELSTQCNGGALSRNTSYHCLSQAIASCVSDPQRASGLTSLTFSIFISLGFAWKPWDQRWCGC